MQNARGRLLEIGLSMTTCRRSKLLSCCLAHLFSLASTGCIPHHDWAGDERLGNEASGSRLQEQLDRAIAGDSAAAASAAAAVRRHAPLCGELERHVSMRLRSARALGTAGARRALGLYLLCPGRQAPSLFESLAQGKSTAAQRTAWQLAKARPSAAMADRIGKRLAAALESGQIDPLLDGSVAKAIVANQVPDSFTFLRRALTLSGHPAFAKGLIALEPARASEVAMSYLAKISFEELHSSEAPASVNLQSALVLLEHLRRQPPSVSHPNFGHLFLYATAVNEQLAGRARAVLAELTGRSPAALAAVLASMAREAQLGYIATLGRGTDVEAARDFGRELRLRTSYQEVMAAIDVEVLPH
jgi:hypothetical protein